MLNINEFVNIVNANISNIIDNYENDLGTFDKYIKNNLKYFKELALNDGKRIRAYLIYLGANLYEDTPPEVVLDLSAAIEIFHIAVLIHDDIMDQSDMRRGIDSYHIHESKKYNNQRIGESIAIAIGDAGFFMAKDIILRSRRINKSKILNILKEFNDLAIKLSYGQIYDLLNILQNEKDTSFEQILEIFNLKTGSYTFTLPLHMGILSKTSKADVHILDKYAYNAGLVFQLTDDVLDVFADISTTGKPNFIDIRNGKLNSIVKLLLDSANKKDKKEILEMLNGEKKFNEVFIMSMFKKYKVRDKIDSKIETYTNLALKSLEETDIRIEIKEILKTILISIKSRTK